MLILSRKAGESLVIDGRIIVKIIRVEGETVKIGIQAPLDVPVHREEVYEEIQRNNREALTQNRPAVPKFPPARPEAGSAPAQPEPVPVQSTRPS